MNSTTTSTSTMSSPTLLEFIRENITLLESTYKRVKGLNPKIEFSDYCKFAYYHSY